MNRARGVKNTLLFNTHKPKAYEIMEDALFCTDESEFKELKHNELIERIIV